MIRILRGVFNIFNRVKIHLLGDYDDHYSEDLCLGSDQFHFTYT